MPIFREMKRLPIGIQDFRSLREDKFLYIDKSEPIFQLAKSGKYFFLSRPRRFGKSLLLSTIKYLFLGKKELFKGLWLEGKYDFPSHPVLHFSFSTIGYKDIGLSRALHQAIDGEAQKVGIHLTKEGIESAICRIDCFTRTK